MPLGERAPERPAPMEGDDSTRAVAVERGAGAAEHLGPLDVGEVDVGQLALAVGKRLGHAVEQDLDARTPKFERLPNPRMEIR